MGLTQITISAKYLKVIRCIGAAATLRNYVIDMTLPTQATATANALMAYESIRLTDNSKFASAQACMNRGDKGLWK